MVSVNIGTIIQYEYNWLTYLTCFFWGLQDGIVNTHTFALLGGEFDEPARAFSIYVLSRGVVIFAFELAQSFIGKILDQPDGVTKFKIVVLIYTIGVGVLGIISLTITYFFKYRPPEIKPVITIHKKVNP